MRIRASALTMACLSALLVSGIATPRMAHAEESVASRVQVLEQEEFKANIGRWAKVVGALCDGIINPSKGESEKNAARERLEDDVIEKYDQGYRLSPLKFSTDPVDAARADVMTVLTITEAHGKKENRSYTKRKVDFTPPTGFTQGDTLRYFWFLFCSVSDFKSQYNDALSVFTEMYGKTLQPGYDDDEKIRELYDKKLEDMESAMREAGLM
ncbi:hypothetical protein [Nocardia sp. CS682]|uniref:hypothetical protein n=1 Tax=Nocardia sp. CS682 TaxID=1047172 RepID=UPI001074B05A|nr:hypothetical protein [Nocardia sp. CS682]QBS45298.1 hypothetical protein DMB37_39705 [Nocardia sp. CS682]